MPQRSKVMTLPDSIKAELNKKLIAGGFCDYVALSKWLSQQGFEISKSSLHRYGEDFEQRLGAIRVATEQAKAVVEAAGDEQGNMTEALIALVQEQAFNVLVKLNEEDKQKVLPKVGIMVAKLSKASVDQKKFMAEVRAKAKATASDVVKTVKAGGLSAEKAEEIRKQILGIV